jgi:glycosyltransferase involved in cell wall biosynthesis
VKPHKNLPRLIQAFAPVAARSGSERALLVLAGCNDREAAAASLRSHARHHGVDDALRFLGRLDPQQLAVLYRLARVFAFPSLWEGYGLPVLEAMASGTPVLAGDTPALREVARDAALYAAPESVAELTTGLVRLWSDDRLRLRCTERGRAIASATGWEESARAVLGIYREVLAKPGTQSAG